MSYRIKAKHKGLPDIVVFESPPDCACELCGKVADCRPYGPRGEQICFECGMKNRKVTERQMNRILYGKTCD
jgi:hypothetical protein